MQISVAYRQNGGDRIHMLQILVQHYHIPTVGLAVRIWISAIAVGSESSHTVIDSPVGSWNSVVIDYRQVGSLSRSHANRDQPVPGPRSFLCNDCGKVVSEAVKDVGRARAFAAGEGDRNIAPAGRSR